MAFYLFHQTRELLVRQLFGEFLEVFSGDVSLVVSVQRREGELSLGHHVRLKEIIGCGRDMEPD